MEESEIAKVNFEERGRAVLGIAMKKPLEVLKRPLERTFVANGVVFCEEEM